MLTIVDGTKSKPNPIIACTIIKLHPFKNPSYESKSGSVLYSYRIIAKYIIIKNLQDNFFLILLINKPSIKAINNENA